MENATTNKLVGGKFDLLVGSSKNGSKPMVKVLEQSRECALRNVYIGSLAEAKTTDVNLLPLASATSSLGE